MNDRAVGLLEQYEIEVNHTRKGRGAILCDTNQGCYIFKEYVGSEQHLQIQNKLLTYIGEKGSVPVEAIVPNKEGELFVKDNDGVQYVLKTYFEGRECNIHEKGECLEAIRLLARLQDCMELPVEEGIAPVMFSPAAEYEKRNRELRKVRKYLQQKSQKTWFEIHLRDQMDFFLEQALAVTEEWAAYQKVLESSGNEEGRCFCHGDYQYHNIILCDGNWCIINFEKCAPDSYVRDLYLFMRKLLEKSNWSIALGKELIATYENEHPIAAIHYIDLYYRLAYPEKFWKIANFYYNSGKAWIPERNQEKLKKLVMQEKEKQHFLQEVFCNVTKR